ncbi:unnamed protein product [Parnassius mnemosyne]|uniref:NADH dehydrogenase [ubiquinone] 1 beta subcomplex subunit 7 n=1 Tax=Parnassius mnemosyne TaxID=213953 RepID=A0AAV1LV13_9NEOP
MPGDLGCIDFTYVAMIRPSQNEERHYCRKQYLSFFKCAVDMQYRHGYNQCRRKFGELHMMLLYGLITL